MRADAWRFGKHGNIDIADAAAERRTRRAASSRKSRDAAPFHLRVGRREVLADVAVADCAEQGIRQRMQNDIRIGMAFELVRMTDSDAAEPDMIAFAEAVDVEPVPTRGSKSRSERPEVAGRPSARCRQPSSF